MSSSFPVRRILFIAGCVVLVGMITMRMRLVSKYDPDGEVFPTHVIVESGQAWRLEIANTDALRTLGLGERDSFPSDQGMLFLFDEPGQYGFWMQGMRFPLDMVFLLRGEIIFIERGIQPGDPKIVMPPTPVDQVLELNAGETTNFEVGDRVWYWR